MLKIKNTKDSSTIKKSYLIFGPTKTGKTFSVTSLPKGKVLVANSERNLDSIDGADVMNVDCNGLDDINLILDSILSGEVTPEWFFLDSITDLMTKVFNETKKKLSDGRQVYTNFEEYYHDIISKMKSLPCHIVVTARQTQVKDEITGGLIYGAALPWAKIQSDLPFNFSAVLATVSKAGEDGKIHYAFKCHPCSQYQVGIRTRFGEENPLKEYEPANLLEIHKKITNT